MINYDYCSKRSFFGRGQQMRHTTAAAALPEGTMVMQLLTMIEAQRAITGRAPTRDFFEALLGPLRRALDGRGPLTPPDIAAFVDGLRATRRRPADRLYPLMIRKLPGFSVHEYDVERARWVLERARAGDAAAIDAVRGVATWLLDTGRDLPEDLARCLVALCGRAPARRAGRHHERDRDQEVRAAVLLCRAAGLTATAACALVAEALGMSDKNVWRIVTPKKSGSIV
jgi:hypothetical protein